MDITYGIKLPSITESGIDIVMEFEGEPSECCGRCTLEGQIEGCADKSCSQYVKPKKIEELVDGYYWTTDTRIKDKIEEIIKHINEL